MILILNGVGKDYCGDGSGDRGRIGGESGVGRVLCESCCRGVKNVKKVGKMGKIEIVRGFWL